jgi:TolA-binding protein
VGAFNCLYSFPKEAAMKKYILMTAMVLALASPGAAWSQTPPTSGSAPSNAGGAGSGQMGNGQNFQEHKAEILKRLNQHLSECQQRISCVNAAADHEALHACMPPRGEGPSGGGQK